jgi:hypothetical protein
VLRRAIVRFWSGRWSACLFANSRISTISSCAANRSVADITCDLRAKTITVVDYTIILEHCDKCFGPFMLLAWIFIKHMWHHSSEQWLPPWIWQTVWQEPSFKLDANESKGEGSVTSNENNSLLTSYFFFCVLIYCRLTSWTSFSEIFNKGNALLRWHCLF